MRMGVATREQACPGSNGTAYPGCGGIRAADRRACFSRWACSYGAEVAHFLEPLLAGSAVLRGRRGWRKRSGVGTWRMRAWAASALVVSFRPKCVFHGN